MRRPFYCRASRPVLEEIAYQLKISQKTVKSHLNNIFRKLRLDGRVALALLAQERGAHPKV